MHHIASNYQPAPISAVASRLPPVASEGALHSLSRQHPDGRPIWPVVKVFAHNQTEHMDYLALESVDPMTGEHAVHLIPWRHLVPSEPSLDRDLATIGVKPMSPDAAEQMRSLWYAACGDHAMIGLDLKTEDPLDVHLTVEGLRRRLPKFMRRVAA